LKKTILISLEGGCGNQLFQFFAGLYLARREGVPLRVDVGNILGNRHDGYSIAENQFLLNLPQVEFFKSSKSPSFWSKAMEMGGLRFRAEGVGFPENFAEMKKAHEITGYFQTTYFFRELVREGLINPDEFKESLSSIYWERSEIQPPDAPAAIFHIRRGDFANLKKTIGMLSAEYFFKLSTHPAILDKKIYLISNILQKELSNTVRSKFDFEFINSEDWHPLGVISFISQFEFIGIANSTLSWWGGYLQESGKVVAPQPWFAGIPSPKLFIPEAWELQSSIWER